MELQLRLVRRFLWLLVALAIAAAALLFLLPHARGGDQRAASHAETRLGGRFTLVGADGKPFSSAALDGKPYAIFFGFTRCGDVCPTTLSRLARLREHAGGAQAFNIIFVTIDPTNDGPKEVGQYAGLFNSPIVGLTGSKEQIDAVKKQYGIYAEPVAHASAGQEMAHTGTVLLFDARGELAGTVSSSDPDAEVIGKLRAMAA